MPSGTKVVASICSTIAGPSKRSPGSQTVAIIDRARREALALRTIPAGVRSAPALRRSRSKRPGVECRLWHHAGRLHPERDQLHRFILGRETIEPAMHGGEAVREIAETVRPDLSIRQWNGKFIVLTGIAHVDGARDTPVRRVDPFIVEPGHGHARSRSRNASIMSGNAAGAQVSATGSSRNPRANQSADSPIAHRMPGLRGTRTRPMSSSFASRAACSGPAPPNAISV